MHLLANYKFILVYIVNKRWWIRHCHHLWSDQENLFSIQSLVFERIHRSKRIFLKLWWPWNGSQKGDQALQLATRATRKGKTVLSQLLKLKERHIYRDKFLLHRDVDDDKDSKYIASETFICTSTQGISAAQKSCLSCCIQQGRVTTKDLCIYQYISKAND